MFKFLLVHQPQQYKKMVIPIIRVRPLLRKIVAGPTIVTLDQRRRCNCNFFLLSLTQPHTICSFRQFTSIEISNVDSPSSDKGNHTVKNETKSLTSSTYDDQISAIVTTRNEPEVKSPRDNENSNTITTTPLDEPDVTAAQSKNIVDDTPQMEKTIDINIPGSDSHVIIVSDDLIEMIKQNSELVMANMPSIDKSESNEPLVGAVPIIYYRGKETYFQFDYRNHPPIVDNDTKNLLRKIERALRNIHLEPIGNIDRGVETMKANITNMKEGEDYRVARKTYNKFGVFEPLKELPPKTTRYTLLKSLTERHALYATGNNPRFGSLKWVKLGQSLFGVDSEVEVKAKQTEIIIRDLWCNGKSTLFEGLQRRHFAMKRRREDRKWKRIAEEEMKHLSYPGPIADKNMKQEKIVPRAHSWQP